MSFAEERNLVNCGWYWQGKTEVPREKLVQVSLDTQQTDLSYAWRKIFARVKPYWNFWAAKPV